MSKISVNFYLRPGKSQTGKKSVLVFVSTHKSRFSLSTGESVDIDKWDSERQRVKRNVVNGPDINFRLDTISAEIAKAFRHLIQSGPLDVEKLKAAVKAIILGYDTSGPPPDSTTTKKGFWDLVADFMEYQKANKKTKTVESYNSLFNRLKVFEKNDMIPITLPGMDMAFFDRLKVWYQNCGLSKKTGGQGLLLGTINQKLVMLKTFLRWAESRKHPVNPDFREVKPANIGKVDNLVLSALEIERLWQLNLANDKPAEIARDLFLFAFYTVQRFSDVMNFEPNQLRGSDWILRQKKTDETVIIPLNETFNQGRPLEILRRYDYQLPKRTLSWLNKMLKKVFQRAGFTEEVTLIRKKGAENIAINSPRYIHLSTHTARRSAITLLLQNGIPPHIVMKLSGHKSPLTMARYEYISSEAISEALSKVDFRPKYQVIHNLEA